MDEYPLGQWVTSRHVYVYPTRDVHVVQLHRETMQMCAVMPVQSPPNIFHVPIVVVVSNNHRRHCVYTRLIGCGSAMVGELSRNISTVPLSKTLKPINLKMYEPPLGFPASVQLNLSALPAAPRKLPPDSIFSKNHLGYVMSSEETIRTYLVEALEIDITFIDKFTVHNCITALEHTLHCRPPDIPTEYYLKSQRLWIMHKLLMSIGLRANIQTLLSNETATEGIIPHVVREHAITMTRRLLNRLEATTSPLSIAIDEFTTNLQQFQTINHDLLMSETQRYVDRRCNVIRWFAWVICANGEQWLKTCTTLEMIQAFKYWLQNPPVPPERGSVGPPPQKLKSSPALTRK